MTKLIRIWASQIVGVEDQGLANGVSVSVGFLSLSASA